MPMFLSLRHVSKRYGGVQALEDIAIDLAAGEVHCLLGENGSGKSTLIKIISGVEKPAAGAQILVDGTLLDDLTPSAAVALGIQVIYQDLSLFPNLTVAENICADEMLSGDIVVRPAEMRARAQAAIARIGVRLESDTLVGDLSIAQRQLVAICRALASKARMIIMDEPTASLTRSEVNALIALIHQLRSDGVSILFVSHRLEEVMEVVERATILRDGRLVGTFPKSELSASKLSLLMTGREFAYQSPTPLVQAGPPVLSVAGLTRRGEFEDISFDLHKGEILGITGLLGSGRTELALAIFGITNPHSGSITIDGEPHMAQGNQAAIARGIAYVPEDRLALGLVLRQSIADNTILAILDRLTAALGLFDARKRRKTVDHSIQSLAIKVSDPAAKVSTLSGGNQQRVVLAKWIAREPKVLILDSPTVGVDINAKDGIYAIIRGLAERGVGVIIISDEVDEALHHSHRIMVMGAGRKIAERVSNETSVTEIAELING